MNVRHKAAATAVLGGLSSVGTLLAPQVAFAHGDMQTPAGRAYTCFLEGAESPDSEGCKEVVAENGAAPIYDWMSNRIGDASGRHQELIPDGKLCSANNPTYSGFDSPATAWPTTQLQTGDVNLEFKATAKHKGGFQVFITKDGWDPSKPLAWGDLEEVANVDSPPETAEGYSIAVKIPENKTGQHMLYTIWQRTDSPEAFYSCSDVVFGQQGTAQTGALEAQQPADSTPAASHDHGTHETTQSATPAAAPSFWDQLMSWFA